MGGQHGDKFRYLEGSPGSWENLILGSESGRKGALYDSFENSTGIGNLTKKYRENTKKMHILAI